MGRVPSDVIASEFIHSIGLYEEILVFKVQLLGPIHLTVLSVVMVGFLEKPQVW